MNYTIKEIKKAQQKARAKARKQKKTRQHLSYYL